MLDISKIKTIILTPVLFFGILGLAKTSQAATYYVATNGDDARTTTQAQNINTPWRTLQLAGERVEAGDTVYIRGGTYSAFTITDTNGTAEAPISFSGYQDEEVIIEGAFPVSGWSKLAGYDHIYTANWASDFMDVEWHDENHVGSMGFVNVDRIFDFGHWLKPVANIPAMTAGTWYYEKNASPQKLYVWLTNGNNPADHVILSPANKNTSYPISIISCDYWIFKKMKLQEGIFGVEIQKNADSHHITFDDMEITGCQSGFVSSGPETNHHIVIQNSHVHHVERIGIQLSSAYSKVQNCEVDHANMCPWSRWDGYGIEVLGSHAVIQSNYVHNIIDDGGGIGVKSWSYSGDGGQDASYQAEVKNNRVENIDIGAVACYGCDSGVFSGNIIYNGGYCISIIHGGPGNNMTESQWFANNNLVVNNNCVDCAIGGLHCDDGSIKTIMKNNIIVNTPNSLFPTPASQEDQFTSDYNNIYPGRLGTIWWNGTLYKTLAAYQAATCLDGRCQDTNSIATNPLFVSASDFHLQSSSPAIDAGTDVGLTSDFDGNPIVGAPDIGAYEFQPGKDTVSPDPPRNILIR